MEVFVCRKGFAINQCMTCLGTHVCSLPGLMSRSQKSIKQSKKKKEIMCSMVGKNAHRFKWQMFDFVGVKTIGFGKLSPHWNIEWSSSGL